MNVAELIVEETKELGDISRLQVAPELAELLSILAHACRPRFAVEVGTFTGLSSLKIAEALPEEGRLLCCDISDRYTAPARRYWHMAGVGDRVDLVVGRADETLSRLDRQVDFAFIDILQPRPIYDLIVPWLSPNGLIVMDNLFSDDLDPTFPTDLKADPRVTVITVDVGGRVAIIQPVGPSE
tara:strand:+ start:674 stop:1222 length:549 start_codon:yes stop_codon:yes gene_type:complete